ncbi:MAG: NAD-dependent epimerase/dehydratase family protein [Chloroflexi bacterium]|nr:NAD-dependent epimerase/dehydratase family protein [Chloroflexota bacterium]
MKAFVTGGTGFIGQRVIQKLLARGYQVYAVARSANSAQVLADQGCTVVHGDITDTESMREGMAGSDVVFHMAAWYDYDPKAALQAEAINVGGTRKVLRLAHELGIPKIIYTSTVAVFGDTHGQLVDETFYQGGPFLSEYDRTKWLAHYKVALPLIEKGAPIIIVMPGVVYGPGDTSLIGTMMKMFYQGLPALPGPDLMLTFAHVDDIAEGHILAAEKGKIGESYVLAGPAIPLGEMVDFWAHLTNKPAPLLRIPSQFVKPFSPLVGAVGNVVPLPPAFSREAINLLGATYIARADKARAQLGWETRPLQIGMQETFNWIAEQTAQKTPPNREKQLAGLAIVAAVGLFLLWFMGRRRK